MNTEVRERNRIIVALDALDPHDVALNMARHLHSAATNEFRGLFVEDTFILQHAQSSLAKEVSLSGRERPLQRTMLERQLRAQSTRIREQFESAASQLGLYHSFRVARGELLAEVMDQANQAYALVLSLTKNSLRLNELVQTVLERLPPEPLSLLVLAREGWFSGHFILVLVTDPDAEQNTLQTAARIAKQSDSPLKIILGGKALEERESRVPEIVRNLKAQGVELAEIVPMTSLSAPSIVQLARNHHAKLLIIPSSSPINRELVCETSKNLPSALMIIRSPD
ncbi:MAG: hypothetical protein ACU843_02400 [Gammaproteobacteria bacterium]